MGSVHGWVGECKARPMGMGRTQWRKWGLGGERERDRLQWKEGLWLRAVKD